jgi:hypothetical protein
MTRNNAINAAIAAGVLNDEDATSFDSAGNYRVHDIKDGEIVFENIISGALLHWILDI